MTEQPRGEDDSSDQTRPGRGRAVAEGVDAVPTGRVVVGVDGSSGSITALRWAARRARHVGVPLLVVACWPDHEALFVREVPGHFSWPRNTAALALETAVAATSEDLVGVEVSTALVNAHPVDALVARCTVRDVLVLGAPARDHTRGRLGVVALCSALAPCRVLVIASFDTGRLLGTDV